MLNYHPSTELLIDYSAGSLSLAHSLSIATHLEQCKTCRQNIAKLEQIGSHLFNQTNLVTKSNKLEQLKHNLFDRLDDLEPSAKAESATQANNSRVPKSLRQFIPVDYDSLNWLRLSSSFQVATLCKDTDGRQVALTRVRAGCSIPNHAHTGDETTLVLEGSFSDEDGIYRKGDFIYRNQKHKHKPVVTKDAECICLTVLDAPIQFTGFFTRWLNPILRKYHPSAIL